MKIISSEKCTEYFAPSIPETPKRVRASARLLQDNGFDFVEPRSALLEEVFAAHTPIYLEDLKAGNYKNIEDECPPIENILDYSLLSAGGALTALDISLQGETTFSLMRPPGHHAGSKVMGFCYLNNAAITAIQARKVGVERVAVLDIDYHHGNGTQEILLCRPGIMHADIHEENGWPKTGNSNSLNCLNYLVPKKCHEKEYLKTLDDALNMISFFDPNVLIISAGFDTYRKDPVGALDGINIESFSKIGKKISSFAKDSKIPVCSILEGGYSHMLPLCILNYVEQFK